MELIRTIKISGKQVKTEKNTFISWSAQINGKWYKIKFTQKCLGEPKERGIYDLKINLDKCSLQTGKEKTLKDGKVIRENDVIWVNEIIGIRKYTDDELSELNRDKFEKAFGETPELPF